MVGATQRAPAGESRGEAMVGERSGGGYALLDFGSRPADGNGAQSDALALLAQLTANDDQITLRAVNVPPGDALGDALTALNCPVVATQREMRLPFS